MRTPRTAKGRENRIMQVNVSACYHGHDRHSFRLEWTHNGQLHRESVPGEQWTRATAREALDLLSEVYGLTRERIRFNVH